MTASVCLQVAGVDLNDDYTLQLIGEHHLAGALWRSVDGLVTATIYPTGSDPIGDAIEFADRVERHLPGADVRRVDPDLVSARDILTRTGFTLAGPQDFAGTFTDQPLPVPFATVGSRKGPVKVWLWRDYATWFYGSRMTPDWLDAVTVARIDTHLASTRDHA